MNFRKLNGLREHLKAWVRQSLSGPQDGHWVVNDYLWNIEWGQNRRNWCVTKVSPRGLADFRIPVVAAWFVQAGTGTRGHCFFLPGHEFETDEGA